MFSVFKEYISTKGSLTDDQWAFIESVTAIKKLRKHQLLLKEGDIWNHHAFICNGCVRRYYIDSDALEHTIQFSIENWWTGDRESLLNGTPSKYNIEAIENTSVLLIGKEDFDKICIQIPSFSSIINSILQKSLNTTQKRIQADISLSAEDKFLHFMESFPKIANRVPRHMLASYLGVSPETLSRIRKSASKK